MGALTKSCDSGIPPYDGQASMPDVGRPEFPAGHLMIRSVELRNFRSFNRAKLSDLSRINIVVGDNGSGKTALLEGMFLAAGPSPEIALRTRQWRGYEGERYTGTVEELERALWGDMFHNFNFSKPAVVTLTGTQNHNRTLRVTARGEKNPLTAPNRIARRSGKVAVEPIPIEFRWQIPLRNDLVVYPRFDDGRLYLPHMPETEIQATFFAANRTYSAMETAQRFSSLSKLYQDEKFVRMFTEHFQRITGLSIQSSAQVPMLFADVTSIAEKIPLSLTSGGMNKLAAILLTPANQPGGVVLIDEIESGFYHKRLPQIWRSIYALAVEYKSQVFASTHSAECLEAVSALAAEHPDDFSLIRPVMEGGETVLRQFSGSRFVTAMEEQIDIR
jgi:ABC-type cobalamin/Fe3+-siderophores transport system ATPase subunit